MRWIKEKWEEIKMFSKVYSFLANILAGIQNIYKWLPTIWRDRDWDEYFLLQVISFKLRKMGQYHSKYGSASDSEKIANDLINLSKVIDRLAEDNGYKKIENEKRKLAEKIKLEFKKDEDGKFYTLVSTNLNKEEEERLLELQDEEQRLRKKDLKYVLRKIESDIFTWWD